MRSILSSWALAAAVALSSPLAAAQTAVAVDARVEAGTDGDARTETLRDRTCLRQTGTRIHLRERARSTGDARATGRQCVAAHGRVYTRADLDSTGHVDIADALRTLDPSIR